MAVLGILIEAEEATIKQVGQVLHKRFRRSRFSHSTAQNSLERLAGPKHQWVRLTCAGEKRSFDCYAPTPKGERIFDEWMRALPGDALSPAIREAMYGRIELCRLQDLPALARLAEAEVAVSEDLFKAASRRRNSYTKSRRQRDDYLARARSLLLWLEPNHWDARATGYQELADGLNEIIAEMRAAGIDIECQEQQDIADG